MKKLLFFLFTLVVLASGCGKKNTFTLEGSIKGLPSDTILVFYQETRLQAGYHTPLKR